MEPKYVHHTADLKWKGLGRTFLAMAVIILLQDVAEGYATSEDQQDETGSLLNTKIVNTLSGPTSVSTSSSCPPDIDSVVKDGLTPLQRAAEIGHLYEAKHLIQTCRADVNAFGGRGSTAIHEAAFNGHATVVSFLIESGADPDLRKTDGWAAIHLAMLNPDPIPVLRALLDGGANPELKVIYELTPVQIALEQRKPQVKEFLDQFATSHLRLKPSIDVEPVHMTTMQGLTSEDLLLTAPTDPLTIEA